MSDIPHRPTIYRFLRHGILQAGEAPGISWIKDLEDSGEHLLHAAEHDLSASGHEMESLGAGLVNDLVVKPAEVAAAMGHLSGVGTGSTSTVGADLLDADHALTGWGDHQVGEAMHETYLELQETEMAGHDATEAIIDATP